MEAGIRRLEVLFQGHLGLLPLPKRQNSDLKQLNWKLAALRYLTLRLSLDTFVA